jgi:ATP-binding cassette subfamily C protein
MDFEADVNDGKFSRVKISLHDGKLEVNGNSYNLSDIEDVSLEEGLGINRIYITYKGRKVLIAEFTNRKKEGLLTLYYALKNGYDGRKEEREEEERKTRRKKDTRHFIISLISPYKYKIILGTILSSILVILSLIPPYLLKILINNVFQDREIYLFPILIASLISVNVLNVILSALQNFILNLNGQRIVNGLRCFVDLFNFSKRLH